MSAPLVVNTTDGTVWTRRDATRDGLALYAPEKCGGCPEFVMATYAELEGHGIAGQADVLPMPAGPAPLSAEQAEVEARRDRYAKALYEFVNGAFAWEACDDQESWRVEADAAIAVADDELTGVRLSLFEEEQETARLRAEVAELEAQRERRRVRLVALSNDALNMRGALSPMGEARKVPMPLGETLLPAVEWLIGRVAELEARPSPADVLRQAADDLTAACPDHGDADEAWMDCPCEFADELRRKAALAESDGDACTCPPADRVEPHQVGCALADVPLPGERPVNGFTAVFASVASLREPDGEHYPHVHHDYRVSHDLPETGGQR